MTETLADSHAVRTPLGGAQHWAATHGRAVLVAVCLFVLVAGGLGAFFVWSDQAAPSGAAGGEPVDACDKAVIERSFPGQAGRLNHLCYWIGEQKQQARQSARNLSWWHYRLQMMVLFFSAVATILVAMKDTNETLARFAILPTALVTLLTGIASLYGFQNRYFGAVGTGTALAALEGEVEYAILKGIDEAARDGQAARLDDAAVEEWHGRLATILGGSNASVLEAIGKSATAGVQPSPVADAKE